jgi:hypothetical protein
VQDQDAKELLMLLEFPRPADWNGLEHLTAMLVEYQYGMANVQRYGRQGQKQNGVDILASVWAPGGDNHIAYQCKLVQDLALSEVEAECTKAKAFKPAPARYVVVTSIARDAKLQSSVRGIPAGTYGFEVDIWFWDDLNERLNRSADAAQAYFSTITLEAQPAAAHAHAQALHRALDRSAFKDSIHQERDIDELIEALAATRGFMRTGILYDNRRNLVESTAPHWKIEEKGYTSFCDGLCKALDKLYDFVLGKRDDLRDTTTNNGVVASIEFMSQRSKLIERANREFVRHSLPALPIQI